MRRRAVIGLASAVCRRDDGSMANGPGLCVARIDRDELSGLPAGTPSDRGGYLRRLLRGRGIDPDHLFRLEYHPRQRCWLATQDGEAAARPRHSPDRPAAKVNEQFYWQTMAELARTARAACAALAARSSQFAHHGRDYSLPEKPQELTPAQLRELLDLGGATSPDVQFDSQGGWRPAPQDD